MTAPFFSICIPAYRAERYLAETLDSVGEQTYPHWELIIVEDGSADRTAEIVAAFARTVTQCVRYLRHEINRGLPATRNTAIDAAHSEWIALLDSDDLWTPDHLDTIAEVIQQGGADLVHAGSVLFDSDTGRKMQVRAPSPGMVAAFPHSLFTGDYIIQPASVALRRDLWRHVGGFDPAFRYVEDRDMWLRCARAKARFVYTGRQTCLYRKHAAALSTHAAEMAEASAAVFDKHLDWEVIPSRVRRRLAAETWAAAGRLRQRTNPALACQHFWRACTRSWRPDWWLRGAVCRVWAALTPRLRPAPQISPL